MQLSWVQLRLWVWMFLCPCPAIVWHPVQGVSRLLLEDSWHRLQHASDACEGKRIGKWWIDIQREFGCAFSFSSLIHCYAIGSGLGSDRLKIGSLRLKCKKNVIGASLVDESFGVFYFLVCQPSNTLKEVAGSLRQETWAPLAHPFPDGPLKMSSVT